MHQDLTVRPATRADGAVLAGFNRAMAHETEARDLDDAVVARGVQRLLERKEYGFYLLAESSGAVVGSLMVTPEWSDWRDGLFWWVQSVYVVPEHRRRGVYRALYQRVRDLARSALDVRGLRLYVERENLSAREVYARLGMHETSYRLYEELF